MTIVARQTRIGPEAKRKGRLGKRIDRVEKRIVPKAKRLAGEAKRITRMEYGHVGLVEPDLPLAMRMAPRTARRASRVQPTAPLAILFTP
jgi:hypothetical protein